MRLIILLLILSSFTLASTAQVTVTSATFPIVGDTLRTVYDGLPGSIVLEPDRELSDVTWDFRSLQGVVKESIYQTTKSQVFISHLGTKESYFKINDDKIELLGYKDLDLSSSGLKLDIQFDQPLLERRSIVDFDDTFESKAKAISVISADQIDENLLDSFPIRPDSLRFRIEINRQSSMDGWGILKIPGGTYDVLREQRTEQREIQMDVKIGTGISSEWIDVTEVVNLDFLGTQTFRTFLFLGEESKEEIAVVSMAGQSKSKVKEVVYKYNNVEANIRYFNSGKPDLLAYPNPAIESIRLQFLNLPTGNYTVNIFNILGVEVWTQDYDINGNKMTKVDLSKLRKGTYLYSLVNENGKTITTKRLIVMRP